MPIVQRCKYVKYNHVAERLVYVDLNLTGLSSPFKRAAAVQDLTDKFIKKISRLQAVTVERRLNFTCRLAYMGLVM